jgi:hypothetical protein
MPRVAKVPGGPTGRPKGRSSVNHQQVLTNLEKTRLLQAIAPFVIAASDENIPEEEALRIAREFIRLRRGQAAA